jgi:hypothetical protein|tara:strand:- start:4631 stop:4939 length:309 start_codon:yes stop_codon:yes gene_type:complete
MFKLNQQNRNALMTIAVLMVIIFALSASKNVSNYQPRPIVIKTVNEKSMFDLENKVECAPGMGKEGSAYTKGLTPGGVCGAQQLVSDYAGYAIEDGIGGSLI